MKRRTALTHLAAAGAAAALPVFAQADRRIVLGQSAAFRARPPSWASK